MATAEVTPGGEVSLDGHIAGRIQGFRYTPDSGARAQLAEVDGADMTGAIAREFELRADRLSESVDGALVLDNDGAIRWLGEPIAKIAGGASLLAPQALILADEALIGDHQRKAQGRVDLWLAAYVRRLLAPLFELEAGAGLEGPARNVAAQLVENLGVLERARVAQDVKALDQNARGVLRRLGVRFGAYYIYIPSLVKPAIRVLATQLWALRHGSPADGAGLHDIPQLAASGRTSFLADLSVPKETYRVAGFRLCGDRAVRVDIVERLADLIRPAVAYRGGPGAAAPPPGSADGDGFVVTGAMTSLTGCSGEQFASVLRSLGFVSHFVKGPALTPAPPRVEPADDAGSGRDAASAADADEADVPADGSSEPPAAILGADAEAADPAGEATPSAPDQRAIPASRGDTVEAEASTPSESDAARPAEAEVGASSEPDVAASDPTPVETSCEPDLAASPPPAAETAEAGLEPDAIPAEEPLVEVWRPRPSNRRHGGRSVARDRAAPQGAEAEARPAAPGGEAAEADGGRPGRSRRPPRPRPAREGEARSGEEPGRFRAGQGPRRPFEPAHRPQAVGERGAESAGAAKDERGRRERRSEPVAAPPRRETPVNLDSPFAKLLALKLQLESKGKGK